MEVGVHSIEELSRGVVEALPAEAEGVARGVALPKAVALGEREAEEGAVALPQNMDAVKVGAAGVGVSSE